MKKIIQSLFICCLAVVFLNNQSVLSHCGKHLSLSTEVKETNAVSVKPHNNQLINNDILWFYPEDTIVMAYVDITKSNVDKVQTIITSKINEENPSKDLEEAVKMLTIMSNFTISFGPDLTFGMIKQLEEEKTPPVFMAVKVKVDNFSIASVASILGGDGNLQKESFNGIEIHRFKGKKNDLIFTTVDNYLLVSENVQILKIAIDNYKNRPSNILSANDALKAAQRLPNNALALVITDNIELSKVMPKSKTEKKEEKPEETNDEEAMTSSDIINVVNEESDSNEIEENQEDSSDCDIKKTTEEEVKPDTFGMYLNKIQQTESYTATALFLENNAVGIKSYTPYNLSFLDSFNPKLKQGIIDMLNSGKYYDVAKSLPSDVAGYFLISNLAGISAILENIDDEKFQKGFVSVKVMFSAMTGIDFDKDLLPMFSGQTTIAVMPGKESPEPLLLLSNSDKSYQTLDSLLAIIHKMEPDANIKDKKIQKEMFTIVSVEKMPVDVAFGTINDAITFGNFEVVKTIAKSANKVKKLLTNSSTYKDFGKLNQEPCNAAIYVEFAKLKEVFGEKFAKDFPEELGQMFKSVYVSVANQKDNVFQITILMQLK